MKARTAELDGRSSDESHQHLHCTRWQLVYDCCYNCCCYWGLDSDYGDILCHLRAMGTAEVKEVALTEADSSALLTA
jgi:ABC-type sulfate transport system permease subunit